MREITKVYQVYTFDELSNEARQYALDKLRDTNVDYDWWTYVLSDSEELGLKIVEFDTYYQTIKGHFVKDIEDYCKTILLNYGKDCDLYKLCEQYLAEINNKTIEDDIELYQEQFLHNILSNYLKLLAKEYDYLTSDESIIETINANNYEFLSNGKLFN